MFRTTSVALLLVAVGLVSCREATDWKPGAVLTSDDLLARSMLVTAADFPVGWAEGPIAHSTDTSCYPAENPSTVGRAEGGTFSLGTAEAGSIGEKVEIRGEARDNAAAFDQLPAQFACLVRSINAGDIDGGPATYSATMREIPGLAASVTEPRFSG
jgi:hypothetical protein